MSGRPLDKKRRHLKSKKKNRKIIKDSAWYCVRVAFDYIGFDLQVYSLERVLDRVAMLAIKDSNVASALHCAACEGHLEACAVLVECGANKDTSE